MDGMHRICKAYLLGKDKIEAVRFRQEPEPDYVGVHPDYLPYEDTRGIMKTPEAFSEVNGRLSGYCRRCRDQSCSM
jgi:hypothetical protein